MQIGGSAITANGTGVSGPGIVSFKDNQIGGNATDGTPITTFSDRVAHRCNELTRVATTTGKPDDQCTGLPN